MRTDTLTLYRVSTSLYGNGNLVRPCRANIYEICPALAESWEHNGDYTQWTFKIRDNARWHDGKPFTAEDAKYFLELAVFGAQGEGKTRAPSLYKAEFGDVTKVEVLASNQVRITLGRPAVQYLATLGRPQFSIAHPPHLMQPPIAKGTVSVAPQDVGWVATGPFKMLKYEKGSRVQVRRFDGYWERDEKGRQLPFLEGVDFPIITDPGAMDAAFRVGRLEGGGYGTGPFLSKERQAGYIRDLGDKVWFTEIGGTRGALGFNVLKSGPVQDVRVRQAIALWVDKQGYIDSTQGGFGYLAPLLHPQNPYSSPDFLTWPGWNPLSREKDRAEAKRLLVEAGYPQGLPLELPCRRAHIVICEFYHGQLAGLGIDVKIRLFDDTTFISQIRVGLDYPIISGGVAAYATIPETAEAEMAPYSISKYGVGKHEDPKVRELFTRISASARIDERIKLWRELERYFLLEKVYAAPAPGILSVVPYRSYVKGVPVPVEDTYNNLDYATTWLDK
jgi:peptide/nickel transport system substrate-binding protein